MSKTVGIIASSGDGKSTSVVINPDGTYNKDDYKGMNSKSTYIINCDKKELPFPFPIFSPEDKNLKFTSNIIEIMGDGIGAWDNKGVLNNAKLGLLGVINSTPAIKAVIVDTINGIMVDLEMLETKRLTYDKWADLAKSIYELVTVCNSLRPDLIIYFLGHTSLYTDIDGNESRCLITNGRKLEKIKIESKLPIVLFGRVEKQSEGENSFHFETQKNRSTGKTPILMFKDFVIPNSLSLVDKTIRDYYKI